MGVAQIVVKCKLEAPIVEGGSAINEVVARGSSSTQAIGGKPV